jgi:putative membrane protein
MIRSLSLAAMAFLAATSFADAQSSAKQPPAALTEPVQNVDTATFIKMVASANEFEIQSSQLIKKANAPSEVKAFAEQMISDHTKAGEEFKAALQDVDQTASTSASLLQAKEQQALERLKAARADQLPAMYIEAQLKAHQKAVALFSNYATSGGDPVLKEFAKKTLPTLEQHLAHVTELAANQT